MLKLFEYKMFKLFNTFIVLSAIPIGACNVNSHESEDKRYLGWIQMFDW